MYRIKFVVKHFDRDIMNEKGEVVRNSGEQIYQMTVLKDGTIWNICETVSLNDFENWRFALKQVGANTEIDFVVESF